MNKQTANEYYDRLLKFERFVSSHYFINNFDKFIEELREGGGKFNVYDVLRNYSMHLFDAGLK